MSSTTTTTTTTTAPRVIKRTKTIVKTTVTSTKVITHVNVPLFGAPVPNTIQQLPPCIIQCIKYIEVNGLNVEGIFRVSANKDTLDKTIEAIQRDSYYMIPFQSMSGDNGVHIASAIMKMYFRELADPLLTFENYDLFIAASAISSVEQQQQQQQQNDDMNHQMIRREKLKNILQFIPSGHFRILGVLCHFLSKIAKHSHSNKMNAYNLAVVFAPNILRTNKTQSSTDAMKDTKYSNDLVTDFIEYAEFFFPGGDQIAQAAIDEQLTNFLTGITSDSPPASPTNSNNSMLAVKKPSATKERFLKQRRASDVMMVGDANSSTKMAGSSVVLRKRIALPTPKSATSVVESSPPASPRVSSPKTNNNNNMSSPRQLTSPRQMSDQSSKKKEREPLVDEEFRRRLDDKYLSTLDIESEDEIVKFMKVRFIVGEVEPEEERSYLLSTSHVEIDFNDDEIYERLFFQV